MLASPLSPNSFKRNAETDLVNRQFDCPPGIPCGHGPECTPALCDLPGCADADVCQNQKRNAAPALLDRQLSCPPGQHCGPGPECTPATCNLPGCADADVCQPQKQKRTAAAAATPAKRQFDCPPGLHCGPGPECTPATCDLPGCADADVCQNQKRNPESDIVHPVCDICIVGDDGVVVCGCATAPGGGGRKIRRDTEKICPQYCITTKKGQTLCGCAAQDYENSLHGNGSA